MKLKVKNRNSIEQIFAKYYKDNAENTKVPGEVRLIRAVFAFSIHDYILNNQNAKEAFKYLRNFPEYAGISEPTGTGEGFNELPKMPSWLCC